MPQLAHVLAGLDEWYDPRLAESWDAVGLVCGDRSENVDRVHLAVDPVPATVGEAIESGAQLLVTHHPLLLTGVHGVPADDPKGVLVHQMIRAGVALYVIHTNADVANPGVSDALAQRLGLSDCVPLEAEPEDPLNKLVVYVPTQDAERLIDVLAAAGAGQIGDYDRCAWTTVGTGTFRPGKSASPMIGKLGDIESVTEARIEMVLPARRTGEIVRIMLDAHPYEEPAFDVFSHAPLASNRGSGRIGRLAEPVTLRDFTGAVSAKLPKTRWGVRAAGDPDKRIETVAVCGGSGTPFIAAAEKAGADAYLTADLKHHRAVEAVTERGQGAMALIDAAHWATEAPWLDQVSTRLADRFGTTVEVRVSTTITDPWTLHVPSTESSE